MFSLAINEPYKLLTVTSVVLTVIALSRLYWLLRAHRLEANGGALPSEQSDGARHPTFQKLEQTLSQQLILAVIDKFHEVENVDAKEVQRLSLSDERIMSYASLLVQLRKTEVSTVEIHQMISKGC